MARKWKDRPGGHHGTGNSDQDDRDYGRGYGRYTDSDYNRYYGHEQEPEYSAVPPDDDHEHADSEAGRRFGRGRGGAQYRDERHGGGPARRSPGGGANHDHRNYDRGSYAGYGRDDLDRPGASRPDWDDREHGFRGHGPKGYARPDERIREDVCDRLTDDPRVDASEMEISVSNGEVTLSGTVRDRLHKRRAEDCVDRISGVRHVQNNLRIQQVEMR